MTTTLGGTRYLTCAETAQHVRKALKEAFPTTKFSVKSSNYAGGASITVGWTDGPRTPEVEAVAQQYEGSGFDGMVDLKYGRTHYLRPDGSVFVCYDTGTTGSAGVVPPEDNRALAATMPTDVTVVHFGADFIGCNRKISEFHMEVFSAGAWLREHCVYEKGAGPEGDRFGGEWVNDIARGMVWDMIPGEDWATAFNRRYH